MRLAILDHGHRGRARLFQRVARLVFHEEVDDVVKTALHRPDFFGRPLIGLIADVLRGPSYWSPAERELLAVFSSNLNECPFCARVHTETTRLESRGELHPARPDSTRPELRAVLPLLEKVTLAPDDVTSADVDGLRALGVPDTAIIDALYVNFIFNLVNRLANAFEWSWDSDDHLRAGARAIHLLHYRVPSVVLR